VSFRYEKEMLDPVAKWLTGRGFQVIAEYKTPHGICDIVAACLNKRKVAQRLNLGQRKPVGSRFHISLLREIPDDGTREPVSLADLQERYGGLLSKDRVLDCVTRLIEKKLVQAVDTHRYVRLNGWIPLHRRLMAIELKKTRVAEALRQAQANQEFATESYVALPKETACRVLTGGQLDAFSESGIGLISVSKESCRVVRRARRSSAVKDNTTQMHCIEQFWRNWIRDKAT